MGKGRLSPEYTFAFKNDNYCFKTKARAYDIGMAR